MIKTDTFSHFQSDGIILRSNQVKIKSQNAQINIMSTF